jgi:flagellin-like hook-associated protein FlgL
MTDLVKRLRDAATMPDSYFNAAADLKEAADEIERLREAVQRLNHLVARHGDP